MQLNIAAFRYWYTDLQVFDIVNEVNAIPTQQLLNSDADVIGFEAELSLQPIEGLILEGGFGWLDTEFVDFFVKKQVLRGAKTHSWQRWPRSTYSGQPLIAAPEFSFSGVAEYEIATRWGSLVPRYDFSYKSQHLSRPADAGADLAERLLAPQRAAGLPHAKTESSRLPAGCATSWRRTYKVDVFDFSQPVLLPSTRSGENRAPTGSPSPIYGDRPGAQSRHPQTPLLDITRLPQLIQLRRIELGLWSGAPGYGRAPVFSASGLTWPSWHTLFGVTAKSNLFREMARYLAQ